MDSYINIAGIKITLFHNDKNSLSHITDLSMHKFIELPYRNIL